MDKYCLVNEPTQMFCFTTEVLIAVAVGILLVAFMFFVLPSLGKRSRLNTMSKETGDKERAKQKELALKDKNNNPEKYQR